MGPSIALTWAQTRVSSLYSCTLCTVPLLQIHVDVVLLRQLSRDVKLLQAFSVEPGVGFEF
ncbi:Hypothetical predicted protein [Prunus dulcis]|uniref:Uncharacterized protein n=1 Tax=Prunus dulcis TaxID=3755 RepID=A0A5E4FSR4_PRUDU|nr:Hypothetical predicted protein [Prunus dulcis]